MPDLPRSHLVAYVLVGLAVVLAGARWVHASAAAQVPARAATPGGRSAGVRVERAAGGDAVVHVAGEVRHPGVYRLGPGTRVQEAVRRAGGPTRRADLNAINLAAKVEDGRQVIVPRRGPVAAPSGGAPTAASGAGPAVPVNLNTATPDELGTLDGVGPATAAKILAYRQEHGGFGSVDELDQVPGIGEKRLAALRPHVTV
ncbi:MAG: ComEA family DNA-binding protein [Actinobacteria bacterium]|nr:MAG: ComEA family DNA-binding protein [Actinomycetota bacterium]